jgi:chorismate mutase
MDIHHDTDGAVAVRTTNDSQAFVKDAAKQCMDLISERNNLDRAIAKMPAESADRDRLWNKLESVVTDLGPAVEQLASQRSRNHVDLDRKAVVLSTLLRRCLAEDLTPGQAILSLAVSVAEEVHALP